VKTPPISAPATGDDWTSRVHCFHLVDRDDLGICLILKATVVTPSVCATPFFVQRTKE
jgi:hypothetical protein